MQRKNLATIDESAELDSLSSLSNRGSSASSMRSPSPVALALLNRTRSEPSLVKTKMNAAKEKQKASTVPRHRTYSPKLETYAHISNAIQLHAADPMLAMRSRATQPPLRTCSDSALPPTSPREKQKRTQSAPGNLSTKKIKTADVRSTFPNIATSSTVTSTRATSSASTTTTRTHRNTQAPMLMAIDEDRAVDTRVATSTTSTTSNAASSATTSSSIATTFGRGRHRVNRFRSALSVVAEGAGKPATMKPGK